MQWYSFKMKDWTIDDYDTEDWNIITLTETDDEYIVKMVYEYRLKKSDVVEYKYYTSIDDRFNP